MSKLTAVQLRNWIMAGNSVAKSDGDGLTFTMSAKQAKDKCGSWVLRYRAPGAKSQKEVTLGHYPDIPLGEARKLATEHRAKIQQGADVGREKQKIKKETARAWTFKRLADDYLERASERLSDATISGRRQQLRDYVMPKIGHLPAAEVNAGDVVSIVEAAATKSLHVARLVLIAVREVFSHGVARHVVTSNPCAHVKARAIIGTPKERRTRLMLTDDELSAMLPELETIGRQNALMVKILLGTATRIGELVLSEWSHLDFEKAEWTIPKENTKTQKGFVIPLTPLVAGWFAELHTLAFGSRYVLPQRLVRGEKADKPMECTSLNAALNRLSVHLGDKCRRFTPHDLRSTARSHLGSLGVDVLIAERCLNHSLGGLVAVYDQHDYLTERRKALELWSTKIAALEQGKPFNVVPFKRTA